MKAFLPALVFFPGIALAQLAYDGLRPESGYVDYGEKKGALNLQDLKGPPGWVDGAWSASASRGSDLFRFREEAALSFPAVTYPGGGGVEIVPIDGNMRTRGRSLSEQISFTGRTALYMSFLLRIEGPDCQGAAYAAFENIGGNNLGLGAGIHEGSIALLTRTAAGTRVFQTIGPAEPYKTYYFVIKLVGNREDWKGADALEIWVNPGDVSSEEKATETAEIHVIEPGTHSAATEFGLGRLMLFTENFTKARILFDEFALGETFPEVTSPDWKK